MKTHDTCHFLPRGIVPQRGLRIETIKWSWVAAWVGLLGVV
jgi:hypothetical protein